MTGLKIKVCGMRKPENIDAVCSASPDYIGFIFYPKSKRYVGENPDASIFSRVPTSTSKVGVFVNEDTTKVIEICRKYELQVAQLHGKESVEYCREIKESGLTLFKAFSVDDDFNFDQLNDYEEVVDFFLFDTKGKLPGGTGEKFDWGILDRYTLNTPFFLSGGIRLDDCENLMKIDFYQLFAVDINSGFETEPAVKNADKVSDFIHQIRKKQK